MAIQNLPAVDRLAGTDSFAIFSAALGCDARVSLAILVNYLTETLASPGGYVTQYAMPNASGFSVSIAAAGDGMGQSVWLLLTPVGAYAAGTIVLPESSILNDGQELLLNTTQAVTALTVSGNGATVNGAPTTLAANAFFRLRYDKVTNGWYRVN